MSWWQARRFRYVFGLIGLWFGLFAVLRVGFVLFSSPDHVLAKFDNATIAQTFWIGLRFDLRWAILLSLPLLFLSFIPPLNRPASRWMRVISLTYLISTVALALLIYFIDFGHYDYLAVRINATVYRYFHEAAISAEMVWQSYPIIKIIGAWFALLTLMVWLMWRWQQRTLFSTITARPKRQWLIAGSVFFLFFFFGTLGRNSNINWQDPIPLRWNQAFFAGNAAIGAIGINPLQNLWDTSLVPQEDYDIAKARQYYPLMRDWLQVPHDDFDNAYLDRHVSVAAHKLNFTQPPNVVFIMLESLGASRLGHWGNPLPTSPVMDQIAKEAWTFKNFYVPVVGTAKTVWASITGIPDVARQESATRNPAIINQRVVLNQFERYKKFYLIGGNADWANMSGLIRQSIDGTTLLEEQHWTSPNIDVWGISDLDLFKEADKVFKQQPKEQPFFAIIQTAGNHKPYTIPDNNEDFKVDPRSDEEVAKYGFKSAKQYNAVRLLDYDLGRFFELAKQSGYFDNTIFVMYGDHNSPTTELSHLPAYHKSLDTESFNVPGFIYAPKLLPPRQIDQVTSLVDLVPTVASLLGLEYNNSTMGRDVQTITADREGAFLVLVEGSFPVIGMINRDFLVKMNEDGSNASLHRLLNTKPELNVAAEYPEIFAQMSELTRAHYETARYQFYQNRRKQEH